MMSRDSVRVLFIGVGIGALFSIPRSILGGTAVFYFLDGFREGLGAERPVVLERPEVERPEAERPEFVERPEVTERAEVVEEPEFVERPEAIERPSTEAPPRPARKKGLSLPRPWSRGRGPFLDQPAPTFQTTTLGGDPWRLADHRGRVVVLDFWASWCQPCIKQLPELREIHGRYRDRSDFLMIGVSLDRDRWSLENCMEKHGVEWPQLFEEGKDWGNSVAKLYEVRAIPHVVVIDREGIVRAYPRGARLGAELARLLDSEAPALASESSEGRFTVPVPRAERPLPAPAVRALTGTMRHRGTPMSRWTLQEPNFWLRIGSSYRNTHGVELDYDEATGAFEIRKIPSAATLEFVFAENGNWGSMPGEPGDYRATVDYDLAESQDADVHFERVLRLLEPWDNADNSRHSADTWLTVSSPLDFEWEPVDGAVEYRLYVLLARDAAHSEDYGHVKDVVDQRLSETSLTVTLPPSEPFEHYEFSMFAYDDSGERIAYYMSTYSNRYDYTSTFKVATPLLSGSIGSPGASARP